jgi:hypothetical protein
MDDLDKDEHIHDRETQKKLPHQPLSSSNSVFSETSDKIRTSAWITHYHFIYFYLGICS